MSNEPDCGFAKEMALEDKVHQWEIQIHQQKHEIAMEKYRVSHGSLLELNRSILTLGVFGLKASMITNGGAAVALLTYIGALKAIPNSVSVSEVRAGVETLEYFICGVVLTSLGICLAYICQFAYAKATESVINDDTRISCAHSEAVAEARAHGEDEPEEPEFKAGCCSKMLIRTGYVLHLCSFILVVGAMLAFFAGVYTATEVFQGAF